jgi:hypothetical protein
MTIPLWVVILVLVILMVILWFAYRGVLHDMRQAQREIRDAWVTLEAFGISKDRHFYPDAPRPKNAEIPPNVASRLDEAIRKLVIIKTTTSS